MNRRLIALGAVVLFLTACPAKQVTYEATLYYADRDLRYLVPVSRSVTASRAALPASVMAQLQTPPGGLTSVLPEGTTIKSVDRAQDTVTVTLQPAKTGLQGAALVQEAIALSLVGVDGIKEIRLQGLPTGEASLDFSQPTGRPRYPNRWIEADDGERAWVTVCWQTKDHRFLVPVSVPAGSDALAERLAVWQAGPQAGRKLLFDRLWTANAPLVLAGQQGNTVTVTVPGDLAGVDKRWRHALAWTLTEFPGAEHVRLSGNKDSMAADAGGVVDRPLVLNVESHS
ncbi:MAG: GerMN domain-containing protein [Candidatus Sericytochromatia bacterium]|nr:GerMN domain-containing protein [Candidatus Sericytochromatia bacterium]